MLPPAASPDTGAALPLATAGGGDGGRGAPSRGVSGGGGGGGGLDPSSGAGRSAGDGGKAGCFGRVALLVLLLLLLLGEAGFLADAYTRQERHAREAAAISGKMSKSRRAKHGESRWLRSLTR